MIERILNATSLQELLDLEAEVLQTRYTDADSEKFLSLIDDMKTEILN